LPFNTTTDPANDSISLATVPGVGGPKVRGRLPLEVIGGVPRTHAGSRGGALRRRRIVLSCP
jgi:hypothetical protein